MAALVLLAVALAVASVVLAIGAGLAFAAGAWFWWRTRDLRRAAAKGHGVTIEGEYREEREVRSLEEPRQAERKEP